MAISFYFSAAIYHAVDGRARSFVAFEPLLKVPRDGRRKVWHSIRHARQPISPAPPAAVAGGAGLAALV
jgi:hypothetical protein